MQRKFFFSFMIISLLMSSCTFAAENDAASISTTPQAQITIIRSSSTPESPTPIPTDTPVPTKTLTLSPTNTSTIPTKTLTLTPTDVDWEKLPSLSSLVLSVEEMDEIDLDSVYSDFSSVDVSEDVKNVCLLDCVKTKYQYASDSITILMLRAGNWQKAERTVKSLRQNFVDDADVSYYEATENDFPKIRSESWVINEGPTIGSDYVICSAGMAESDVVVLVIYEMRYCFYTEDFGRQCGDDGSTLTINTYEVLNAQIDKIHEALQ